MLLFFSLPHSQQVLLIFFFYGRNKGIALKLGEIWQRREGTALYVRTVSMHLHIHSKFCPTKKQAFVRTKSCCSVVVTLIKRHSLKGIRLLVWILVLSQFLIMSRIMASF
jgi:hypothetical protein